MIAECLVRQKTSKITTFDYIISDNLEVPLNSLVLVPFLNKKVEAIVIAKKTASRFAKKEILKVLSRGPIITDTQLDIAKKISTEFFSDFSSAIFSFLPKINKKDLKSIGSINNYRNLQKQKTPTILVADPDFRFSYYQELIDKEKQNLLVLPKIDDLKNLENKIKKIDSSMKVYSWHSGLSSLQKSRIWNLIINKEPAVILATRHGLFLPFTNLSLIALDDPTNFGYYEDQSPRYNALATSKIIARTYKAKLVIGDGVLTPETFAWVKSQKADLLKKENKLRIFSSVDFNKIFSDQNFIDELPRSKKILVTGFFKTYDELYCLDCGNKVDIKHSISCNACKSLKLNRSALDIKEIIKTAKLVFKENESSDKHKHRIFVSNFSETQNLSKDFDMAIIPHFDSYTAFPFLNFKFKLIRHILDLKQTGIRSVFLCSTKFDPLANFLETKDIDKFIIEELKSRREENMPPFTKIIEFMGDPKELSQIETIIPQNRWIIADKCFAVISRIELNKLQEFYQKKNLELKLRLDPPEFV